MSNQITPNPSVPSQVVAEVTFPNFINNLGIIPTSYKDSMSYYECLAWLCKYLEETVIPTVNQNGEAVEELQALYTELNEYVTNYFDNLDVQEEINNKLDDMVEQGTLQEIIADYLNAKAVFGFDNVSAMKEGTNLINGSYAQTLGFYEKNDGGKALYKIRNITNDDVIDEMTIIEINDEQNQLIAELIEDEKNVMNVLQCGAIPDGETDNSVIFNKIIDYCNANRKNIFIPNGNYVIADDLHTITSSISIYGNVSGTGSNEIKTTIIDNRNSSNYLLNFTRTTLGGTIRNINFKSISDSFVKKCILLDRAENYHSVIENCLFYQYAIGLDLQQAHGISIDKCTFLRCGSSQANSDDFAIKIYKTVDCSLMNIMVDHTRYQLFIDDQSYVSISNSHFEMSTLNVINGKSPIYCRTGVFGQVMFTGCTIIGLSYKYWAEELGITGAGVPFMIEGTYLNFDNCILSCGSGSAEYSTEYIYQCKFANMYYGTISNCKIKAPSYLTNSFRLYYAKIINSHFQVNLETEDYSSIAKNSRIVYSDNNYSKDNFLQFIVPTTDPQTYPSVYPVFSNYYSDMIPIESNKKEIDFLPEKVSTNLQAYNTLRVQSNVGLAGLYHIKVYSTGQLSLVYEGYFRIGSDNKTLVKVRDEYKSFGTGYGLKIYVDDDSHDLYVQVLMTTYIANTLNLKIENLEGHQDMIAYYVPSINQALTYTHSIDLAT